MYTLSSLIPHFKYILSVENLNSYLKIFYRIPTYLLDLNLILIMREEVFFMLPNYCSWRAKKYFLHSFPQGGLVVY